MSLFRGSKNATIVNGEIVATAQDIADAVNDAIAAKNAAEAAEASALNTLDDFDDRYLGAKSSDPTVDNDGGALIDGALYYNTVNLITRVYDLSSDSWSDLKPSASDQANINALGPVASQVETVGDNISDVTTVANDIADVNTVAGISTEVTIVAADGTDIGDVASNINSVDVVASDLAGAGFDYDLGSITGVTEGVVGTPDGFIITVFNIRDDVITVSGIETDVTSVAAINTDVTAVSGISLDVTTTSNNIADIQTVASDLNEITSDINVVSTNISNVNTVGDSITNVNTVAGIDAEVQTVAGIDTDVSTVSSVSSNITTVSGISGDVTTVSGISTDVTEVSSISSDVSTVSGISSDVTTVAGNVTDVTNFADVYIGAASSEPATRSDGSALQAGDLYFDTTLDALRAYDGSSWLSLSSRNDSEIRGLFSAGGDLAYDSATGSFSVTTYKSSDFDTDFASKTTDDLTEGGNLYYTDSRVNARIDSRVNKTFVDALNIDADTLDGQQGTHYLDRTNHTGTQTLSTISDSGALAALNTVDTAEIANQAVTDDKLATSLDLGSI